MWNSYSNQNFLLTLCCYLFLFISKVINSDVYEHIKYNRYKELFTNINEGLPNEVKLDTKDAFMDTSDHRMSAEYMFNVLNNMERGQDVRTASGIIGGDGPMDETDTIRSFSSQATHFNKFYDVYRFKIHSLSLDEQLKRVELRLHHSKDILNRKTKVKYVIKQNNQVKLKFHSKEHIRSDGKYTVIDLSKLMSPILSQHHGNLSVKLSVRKSKPARKEKNKRSTTKKDTGPEKDALLLIFSEDKNFMQNMYSEFMKLEPKERLSRSKRAITENRIRNRTNGKRKRTICQLQDFEIDFNHLGWGKWIVYPKIYNAKICTGVCPSPIDEKFTPTNHAMLQSLMRLGQPKIAPRPCCVPTKLRPLKLLYYEQNEIIVRLHQDMFAESCGCR